MGGWDEDGVTLLKRITSTLARNQGKDEGETAKFLVHRVSLTIQLKTQFILHKLYMNLL